MNLKLTGQRPGDASTIEIYQGHHANDDEPMVFISIGSSVKHCISLNKEQAREVADEMFAFITQDMYR